MRKTKVRELMTTEVVTLEKQQAIPLAQELMRMLHIRHLPVVDESTGHIVGMVTHRGLLGAQVEMLSKLAGDEDAEEEFSIPVGKVLTKDVPTVTPETSLAEALRAMLASQRGCLVVTDDEKVVGILTSRDFLKFELETLEDGERGIAGAADVAQVVAERTAAEVTSRVTPLVTPATRQPRWLLWALIAIVLILTIILVAREATRDAPGDPPKGPTPATDHSDITMGQPATEAPGPRTARPASGRLLVTQADGGRQAVTREQPRSAATRRPGPKPAPPRQADPPGGAGATPSPTPPAPPASADGPIAEPSPGPAAGEAPAPAPESPAPPAKRKPRESGGRLWVPERTPSGL